MKSLKYILPTVVLFLVTGYGLQGIPPGEDSETGTYFSDLIGINGFKWPHGMHGLKNVLSHQRAGLQWRRVESNKGTYNDDLITKWIDRAQNVKMLPLLGYAPRWAEDRSPTTYHITGHKVEITQDGDQLYYNSEFPGSLKANNVKAGSAWSFPVADNHIQDWKDALSYVVPRLRASGMEYFQVWNEPGGLAPFYVGNIDITEKDPDVPNNNNYYNRVTKPAAEAIHDAGGKVVHGGWPTVPGFTINNYINWLDYHNAWDDIDVLSFHYRNSHDIKEMEKLRRAAKQRGYKDIGIWQTEVGNMSDPLVITNELPRFALWAIKHNAGHANRYRIYWYAKVPLFQGKNNKLSRVAKAIKGIGKLLGGKSKKMHIYNNISVDKDIVINKPGTVNHGTNSIEAFRIGQERIVIAVHLDKKTRDDITLSLPGIRDVASASRATPWGEHKDLEVQQNEDGLELTVPTTEIAIPEGGYLKSNATYTRTFFVVLQQKL